MDRMLENASVLSGEGGPESGVGPAVDVYEEGDELVVEAQLPGLKAEDLEVNLERGVLTISGKTRTEQERQERNYLLRERCAGRFRRSPRLPPMDQADDCQANSVDGVLRLVVPRAAVARPHRLQIGTGGQRSFQRQPGNPQPWLRPARRRAGPR
jgi:HSP20 family protein